MTTEREEALELAREAGFIGPIWKDQFQDSFMRLVRLAKQRGAEEQKRKDAGIYRAVMITPKP